MSPGSGKRRRHPVAKVKGGWTSEEDAVLISLVHEYGEGNWSPIAKALNEAFNKTADNGRIGKQCRERWNHHLRPDIKKDAWTEEEEVLLVTAHKSVGNKWSDIARQLPGRTENAVKNHWNATLRRKDTAAAPEGAPQVLRAYMLGLGLLGAGGRGGRNRKRKARDSSEDSADPAWQPYSWGPTEGGASGAVSTEAGGAAGGGHGGTTSSSLAAVTQHHQQPRRASSKRVCSSSRLDQVLAAAAGSSEGSPCGDTSSCSSGEQGSRAAAPPAGAAAVRLAPPPAGVSIKLEPGVCTLEPPLAGRAQGAAAAAAGAGLHRSRTYVSLPTLTRPGAAGRAAAAGAAGEEGAGAAAGNRRSSGRLAAAAAAAGYCGSSADLEDLLAVRTGSSRNLTAAAAAAGAALGAGAGLASAAGAAARGGDVTAGEGRQLGYHSSSRASLAPLEAGSRAAGCHSAAPGQLAAPHGSSSLQEDSQLPAGDVVQPGPMPMAANALDTCAAAAAAAVAGAPEQPAVYPSADLDDTLAWVQSMEQEPVLFEELMSASGPGVPQEDLNQVLEGHPTAPTAAAAGGVAASTSTASHPPLTDTGDLLVASASPRCGAVVDSLLLPNSCSSTQLSSYTAAAAAALLPRNNSSVAQLDRLAGRATTASGSYAAAGGGGGVAGHLVPMPYGAGASGPQGVPPYAAPLSSSCGVGALHLTAPQAVATGGGRVSDGGSGPLAATPTSTSPLLSSVMPEVVVRVSTGPLPSMHQLLALLAAPLPPGHPQGRYVEVSTFTSKGPQSICSAKLAQQLSLRGVAPHTGVTLGALGDAPLGLTPGAVPGPGGSTAAAAQEALVKDVEALLGQLCWGVKGQTGVGRVVVCMRLGAGMAPEETSLVLACTGASGPAASAAVHGLVEQLALVYN